jgi:predicted enzyme related to lactoylglutathione lyase
MSRVIHFEIQATQPAILIEFYEKVFGWNFSSWGDYPYWLIDTGPGERPGINGGLLQRHGPAAPSGQGVNAFVCTVDVPDVDDAVARAEAAGAVLAVPKMAIAGVGWLVYIKDPDGNLLGMMQSNQAAK